MEADQWWNPQRCATKGILELADIGHPYEVDARTFSGNKQSRQWRRHGCPDLWSATKIVPGDSWVSSLFHGGRWALCYAPTGEPETSTGMWRSQEVWWPIHLIWLVFRQMKEGSVQVDPEVPGFPRRNFNQQESGSEKKKCRNWASGQWVIAGTGAQQHQNLRHQLQQWMGEKD